MAGPTREPRQSALHNVGSDHTSCQSNTVPTFNPENLNMVHGVFCFGFEKKWVVAVPSSVHLRDANRKAEQGEISLDSWAKPGPDGMAMDQLDYGGLNLKWKTRASVPCKLHEVREVVSPTRTQLCNCERLFRESAPLAHIRKSKTWYITQELELCL